MFMSTLNMLLLNNHEHGAVSGREAVSIRAVATSLFSAKDFDPSYIQFITSNMK